MMQDRFDSFDQQIRSMMQDVEVKPSRHVWKAVSARIAAPKAIWGGWNTVKWAGAGLAFAAAIALGVFFSGSNDKTGIITTSDIRLAEAQEPVQLIKSEEPKLEASVITITTQRPKVSSLTEEKTNIIPSEAVSGSAEPSVPVSTPQVQKPEQKEEETMEEQFTDPFALLTTDEEEVGRKLNRPSLYAKGAINGNDSDLLNYNRVPTMAPGTQSSGITEQSASVYGVPVTFGLGVRFYVAPKLSIGTGLDYSILTRTFTGKYIKLSQTGAIEVSEVGNVSHTLQYVGIPVDIYYDIINSEKIKFYAYAGAEAELCISNKYTLYSSPKIVHTEAVKNLQYSVGAGLGVEFALSQHLGLYLDPGIKYYFYNHQPKSVRTDKPLMVNFDVGLRFNF